MPRTRSSRTRSWSVSRIERATEPLDSLTGSDPLDGHDSSSGPTPGSSRTAFGPSPSLVVLRDGLLTGEQNGLLPRWTRKRVPLGADTPRQECNSPPRRVLNPIYSLDTKGAPTSSRTSPPCVRAGEYVLTERTRLVPVTVSVQPIPSPLYTGIRRLRLDARSWRPVSRRVEAVTTIGTRLSSPGVQSTVWGFGNPVDVYLLQL